MDCVDNESRSLLLHREQKMKVSRSPALSRQLYMVFFVVTILLIAGGTIIWVLNIIGVMAGPWSAIFGAVFTGTGIIIALLDSLLAVAHAERRRE